MPGAPALRLVQPEGRVGHAHGLVHPVKVDDDGYLYLGGADEVDVDPRLGQGLEEDRGDPAVGLHAYADDRELRDVLVHGHLAAAERDQHGLQCLLGLLRVGLRHREREVGHALAARVLDDHVDVHARVGEGPEDPRGGAGLVGDVADDDLDLVLVGGDAADDDLFHVSDFFFHEGPWIVVERGADFKGDGVLLGELHRARLHHLGSRGRELQHLVVGDLGQLARVLHHPGVGGVDPVHVGVDLALVGLDRGRYGHGRQVRAAAPQGRYLAVLVDALEAGDDDDLPGGQVL